MIWSISWDIEKSYCRFFNNCNIDLWSRFEKDSPGVVDVGLISLGCDDEGEGEGDGFDVI